MKRLLLVALAAMAVLPTTAAARGRMGVFVGRGFAPYGWYGWYSPWYGPYAYAPYAVHPNAGEVKLDTKVKNAEVFIDGSYAGTTGNLKTMWLRPGSYNIEIRTSERTVLAQKIYVVAGKTIKLHPDLQAHSNS
jgi:hypothetical protein